jgi:SAM-dependent methyltransferase
MARERVVKVVGMGRDFDVRQYWETRLERRGGLDAVGWAGLGEGFNRWMYRVRKRVFEREVAPRLSDRQHARVLDVGCGSGFYIDRWLEAGVRDVSGCDITDASVERMAALYPGHDFARFELGADDPSALGEPFDAVSAFDVLFHIVDDHRFEKAIETLAALVRPGGLVVFSDNFVHGPAKRSAHHVNRSLDEVEAALSRAGLVQESRSPVFVLMNEPVDSHSRGLAAWWHALSGGLTRANRLGPAVGAALYPLEMGLIRAKREGPSTELMVCRRTA